MQERHTLTDQQINRDLLRFVLHTPIWFWGLATLFGLGVGVGAFSLGVLFYRGVGIWGENRTAFWALDITNFVFWVGISHAGVMISAILRLTHAEWRRPVTRAAEVLTVFSLATAALFPFIHTGRPWRVMYWVFPYDFSRGLWPNVRSPLIWDPSAVFTYLLGSSMFVYVALLPDLALARDQSSGWRRYFYGVLSLGFRGTTRQWRLQAVAGILLSGLILPVFVSVHSIVSWDFGMSLVPAWHATVFAPYFVLGAVLSGVSAVVTVMVILRRVFRLEKYITHDHFDALGRLLVLVGAAWFYFYLLDFVFAFYSGDAAEYAVMHLRLTQSPFREAYITFLVLAFIIPMSTWPFRRVRRNLRLMFIISLLVNVGMWLERFLIVVPALMQKQALSFDWIKYRPTMWEWMLTFGAIALVCLGFLLFAKLFPIIPAFDIKEGQILKDEIKVGKVKVPAIMHE